MPELIEVVFNLPVDRRFTYAAPPDLEVKAGMRVTAPFGSRRLLGYVVADGVQAPPGLTEIKEVLRRIDEQPLFGPRELSLAQWLSGMYLCSLGEALAAMLPGGRREVEGEELAEEPEAEEEIHLSSRPGSRPWIASSAPGRGCSTCTGSPARARPRSSCAPRGLVLAARHGA